MVANILVMLLCVANSHDSEVDFRKVIHVLFSLRPGITLAFDLWREWLDNDVSSKHNISSVNKGKNNQL